jgi:hypothetical protein
VVGFSGGWGGYYGMAAPQQTMMSHVAPKPNVSQQQ